MIPVASGVLAKAPAWRVSASQESDGGPGACGPIGTGGMWYSELSTVPMGTASDFAALGKIPCGTVLNITNPANGKTVQASKRDVGAGSAFLPVMGLYPATAAALGLSGGQYTVIISRADGLPLHPVRGTPTTQAAGAITRPGGVATTQGSSVDKVFAEYQHELKLPRTAPSDKFVSFGKAGWTAPFQWWWQSFTAQFNKEKSGQ